MILDQFIENIINHCIWYWYHRWITSEATKAPLNVKPVSWRVWKRCLNNISVCFVPFRADFDVWSWWGVWSQQWKRTKWCSWLKNSNYYVDNHNLFQSYYSSFSLLESLLESLVQLWKYQYIRKLGIHVPWGNYMYNYIVYNNWLNISNREIIEFLLKELIQYFEQGSDIFGVFAVVCDFIF